MLQETSLLSSSRLSSIDICYFFSQFYVVFDLQTEYCDKLIYCQREGMSHLEEVVEGEEKGLDINEILLEDIRNSGCHDAKSEMM